MGKRSQNGQIRRIGWMSLLGGLVLIGQPQMAAAQTRAGAQEFALANRVAEALRQVTLLGNTRNPGYYSD